MGYTYFRCGLKTSGGGGGQMVSTMLWENSSYTSDFAEQEVTLVDNVNNYDYIKFVFLINKSSAPTTLENKLEQLIAVSELKKSRATLSPELALTGGYHSGASTRNVRYILYVDETTIKIGDAQKVNGTGTSNNVATPYQIIGLKRSSGAVSGSVNAIPLSAISAGNQESANPASNAASSLTTNRYSSTYNRLTYLELTPNDPSFCANALFIVGGTSAISDVYSLDYTAKIQGYDGSTWVDIDVVPVTAAEQASMDGVIKKFENSTAYSKYRYTFQDYSTHQSSGSRQYCNMCFIELLNVNSKPTENLLVARALASSENNSTSSLSCVYYPNQTYTNILVICIGSQNTSQGTATPAYNSNLTPVYTHTYSFEYNGVQYMRSVYVRVSVYRVRASSVSDNLSVSFSLTTSYQSKSIVMYEIPELADFTIGSVRSTIDTNRCYLNTNKNFLLYANKGINTITGSADQKPGVYSNHTMLCFNSEEESFTAQSSATTNGTVALLELNRV